jgi:starch synthase (maltosyl-transferring)
MGSLRSTTFIDGGRTMNEVSQSKTARTSAAAVDLAGPRRVVIESVEPEVDGGRFAIKRVVGESVVVQADVFADGHDVLAARVVYRPESGAGWRIAPMRPLVNDRWEGAFTVEQVGRYLYTVEGWVDPFESWRRDLKKRRQASQDLTMPLLVGAALVEQTAGRAQAGDAQRLTEWATLLRGDRSQEERYRLAVDEDLSTVVEGYPDSELISRYRRELAVVVDPERARYSTWYELFPRSCSRDGGHGTFKDCEARLPYVAEMGFDVAYLPPIHPIGSFHRKGRNNSTAANPGDVGSPWAIGAAEGGHKAVHPDLGTLEDFRHFVGRARDLGIEVAIDIAFQCSPDHPYVREHPQWFRHRPDGTVQYAENPPKKYEDIYPFDFETEDWRALWEELRDVLLFWVEQGVKIFRVDNPHTKPFGFWEWVIGEVKDRHSEVLFLAEAFTRPKVMHRLAKLGFTQSYTYFTWRNTKWDLTQYFTELAQGEGREYFRPNLWPNTPDILNEYLQFGGRPAFMVRFVLAATLGASYGIYGPAFELTEAKPREPGSEEYADSEKYEVRRWDLGREDSLRDLIARVNRIRRDNRALQGDWSLRFHSVDNDQIIAYSKRSEEDHDAVLVVVNLDAYHTQSGWLELLLQDFGIDPQQPYQMHDLLSGARYIWYGARNYVELDPQTYPAHIFRLRRRVRTERDFEYYL